MDETADNPWADAVASNEATAKSSLQVGPSESQAAENDTIEDVDPDSCSFKTLYQGLQVWHLFDIPIGFLLLLYGSLISSSSVETITVVVILFIGCLVTLRAIAGTLALCTETSCQRFGLNFSANTSPVLAFTLFVVMFINLVVPAKVQTYMEQHHMLWAFLQKWEGSHKGTVTLLLLGAFVLECARWQLVQSLQRKLGNLEVMEEARLRQRADRRNRLPDRPWWWSNRSRRRNQSMDPNDPLTDSLLPVTANRGGENDNDPAHHHSNWTFFGRRRRNNEYTRDEASVDFASVQEEWASRTEEDPYWWSRDEDSTSPPTQEVSWANTNTNNKRSNAGR